LLEYELVSKKVHMKPDTDLPVTIAGLRQAYLHGATTPEEVVDRIFDRIRNEDGGEAWIYLRAHDEVRAEAQAASAALRATEPSADKPLLGIPFAIKDNIDVAGLPTSAACPAFTHTAGESAAVVERLLAAGAILIGKTNLDQFATGLVGTRSPYGAVRNPFNPDYMSGGSSSGSAAVVARGWVAFALGTDTAGSGRIPAGACNLVGVKPTPGLVSSYGVLPACRSVDCVSVLAHTVEDGWEVLNVLAGADARDPYSRMPQALGPLGRRVRLGVPQSLEFFGDRVAECAWHDALDSVGAAVGVELVVLDLAPFQQVARLLYEGPWVAERRVALGAFLDTHADDMDPTVRSIIARADTLAATDAFSGMYEFEALRRVCEAELGKLDMLLVPTAPTIYRHDEIAAEPILLNSRLGTYTNFVNLLGMAALSLPGPFRGDGLPAGVTLLGAAGSDHRLAEFARRLQPLLHRRLGLSNAHPPARGESLEPLPFAEPVVEVAVVGAHLSGLPLNWQLTERGARLVETTTTATDYRLFALPGTVPPKPGLVRTATDGAALEVEVWAMPIRNFGSFVSEIPAPLGIGTLTLADGRLVKGFICENAAVTGAPDVSAFGGWRNYLAAQHAAPAVA